MINPSGNFKDETFGKDTQDLIGNGGGVSLGAQFLNSNPFMNRGFMDNSFPLDSNCNITSLQPNIAY